MVFKTICSKSYDKTHSQNDTFKTYAMCLDLFTKVLELRDQNILLNTVLQINVAPRLKVQVQY